MEVLHLGYFPGLFEKILWLFSLRFLLLWKVSKVGKGIILLQPFPIWIDLRQILFSHSLGNSWQRVPNPRILWRNPYIAYSTFFQILTKLPPTTPTPNSPHTSQSTSLFLLPCFFNCMDYCATSCVILFNDMMDLYMLSLGALPSRHLPAQS